MAAQVPAIAQSFTDETMNTHQDEAAEESGRREQSIAEEALSLVEGSNAVDVPLEEGSLSFEARNSGRENKARQVLFEDHYSLRTPSSDLRFLNARVRVYEQRNAQIQLVEGSAMMQRSRLRRPLHAQESEGDKGEENCMNMSLKGIDADGSAGRGKEGNVAGSGLRRRRPPPPSKDPSDSTSLANKEMDSTITIKTVTTGTTGLNVLRACYTAVAVLVTGFIFIFCLQIILYLFVDLTVAAGLSSSSGEFVGLSFLSTLLALPVFVYGMASAMDTASNFVADTWGRHIFLQTVGYVKAEVAEWICFVVFLGVPVLAMCVTMLVGLEDWWELSALTWFFSIAALYAAFALAVTCVEVSACLDVVKALDLTEEERMSTFGNNCEAIGSGVRRPAIFQVVRWKYALLLLRRAILRRQIFDLSGVKKELYLVTEKAVSNKKVTRNVPIRVQMDPWSRLTTKLTTNDDSTEEGQREGTNQQKPAWKCMRLFHKLDPPVRRYTVEDVLDVTPMVTANSWSLEKMYCRAQGARNLTVIRGKSALRVGQVRSSLACTIMGNALSILFVAALLRWLSFGPIIVGILCVLMILCFLPGWMTTHKAFSTFRDVVRMEKQTKTEGSIGHMAVEESEEETEALRNRSEEDDPEDRCEAIYKVWETVCVTKPTNSLCWACFSLSFLCLFLWPLVHLYVLGNLATASIFLVVGIFSGLRYYLNAAVALFDRGSIDDVLDSIQDGQVIDPGGTTRRRSLAMKAIWGLSANAEDDPGDRQLRRWREKSRLSQVVVKVNRGRGYRGWMVTFVVFILLFNVIAIASIASFGSEQEELRPSPDSTPFLDDFFYEPTSDLRYPTCRLRKGLQIDADTSVALLDYVFLANVAYYDFSQLILDKWFGPGVAVDEEDLVKSFVEENRQFAAPVSYKLVSFPNITSDDKIGVVTVRGTTETIDWLVNAQLWSAAFLSQLLRFLLPFGEIWTPILHRLIQVVSAIGKTSLARVSYYKETTALVEWLKQSGDYGTVQITGHSLGGGIAIITGAQTGIPAIALSGVNALLSRETFDPPLTASSLNRNVFNIIPDRDPIPRIDDVAELFQRIECTAPNNRLVACHTAMRSLCEIMYNCGSGPRPTICYCTTVFGYPEPKPKGNRTFADACKEHYLQRGG